MINEELILTALAYRGGAGPETDLVSLGMIRNIRIGVNQVQFTVVLTTPACPSKNSSGTAARRPSSSTPAPTWK
jgi:ATP-binding protein involved in chromosome partitioning